MGFAHPVLLVLIVAVETVGVEEGRSLGVCGTEIMVTGSCEKVYPRSASHTRSNPVADG